MGKERKTPEFNLELILVAVETLCSHGVSQPTAVTIGLEISKRLAEKFGGRQFYIPQGTAIESAQKAAKIYAEFDGSNYEELAMKYGFSEVWIRELVKRGKAAATKP
jgi:Mor family transcriptional regulator